MSTDDAPDLTGSPPDAQQAPLRADRQVEVVVGRVAKAHGLRGDVLVDIRTDEPERRFEPGAVLQSPSGPLTLRSARWHGRRLLATFAEVTDRTAAEALRGQQLLVQVDADQNPDDPDEYYDHQLVGLHAVDPAGQVLGEVVEMLHLPAQELVAIRSPSGQELLVPFVRDLVADVDVAAGRLRLTPAGQESTQVLGSSGTVAAGAADEQRD
jgi:16S rRNA processing protein RimM